MFYLMKWGRSVRPESMNSCKQLWQRALVMGAIAISIHAPAARGETFPNRPIRLVVPFSAGGATDLLSRILGEQLGHRLGQPVIVENRPGASAGIGASIVAREKPDGYTLLVGTATLASNAVMDGPKAQFDLFKDFDNIGKIGKLDELVVVSGRSSLHTLGDLVAEMKKPSSNVQYGSPGVGSPGHLGGELLRQMTGSNALHIPYKGESAALNDVLGGSITFQLCAPLTCASRVKDGSLRALAIAAKERSPSIPAVPTATEAGVKGFEVGTWYYLAGPKGMPQAVVVKLNGALNEVLRESSFRSRLLGLGVDAEPRTSPADVKQSLEAEMAKWRPVLKAAKL